MGAPPTGPGGRRVCRAAPFESGFPCILLGLVEVLGARRHGAAARDRGLLVRAGRGAVVAGSVREGTPGLRARRLRDGQRGNGDRGVRRTVVVDHLGGRRGYSASAPLPLLAGGRARLVGAPRDAPSRPAPAATARCCAPGCPLPALLFYFVTFGGFIAMAIFTPKLLVDWSSTSRSSNQSAWGGRVPRGGRRDRHPAPGRLAAFRSVRRLPDARDRLRRDRGRRGALATTSPTPRIVSGDIRTCPSARRLPSGPAAAPCSSSSRQKLPRTTPRCLPSGIVGAVGGLGGFFPPLLMGLVK